MANDLGKAYVEVHADTSKFNTELTKKVNDDLKKAERSAEGFGKRVSMSFGGAAGAAESFRKALLPAVAALGGIGAAAFKAGQAASDLAEEQSKATQIFGEGAKQLNEFAASAAQALGQSQRQALGAVSTFGIFGKSAGLAGQDLVDFSQKFTVLASDLASFNNTSPEEAIIAIGAALRGESEPIRRYGVLLDDATLRQTAFKMGITDSIKTALTPQQRVLAATEQIFIQTSTAQGDFARTSEGLANQQRILAAEFENAKVAVGQAFLPVIQATVGALSSLAQFASQNTGAVVALTAAFATIASVVIGVNVAMKLYNTVTIITTGLNKALDASFTRLKVSMGLIGGVLAVVTVAYGLFTASKKEATFATDQLTQALKLEGDAQREALLATLEADPALRQFATFMKNEYGVTLQELGDSLGKNKENANSYAGAIYETYKAGKITFDEMTKHLLVLEQLRDDLLAAADAQSVLNGQMAVVPKIDLAKWYARQDVTIKTTTDSTGKFGSAVDKAAQAMERMRQRAEQARGAIRDTFDRALSVAKDRLDQAKQAFDDFANSVATTIRSSLSFGQSQQDAVANSQALSDALERQAEAQREYNEAIMQPDMDRVIRAEQELAKATQAVMDAQQRPMTFFEQLNEQANKATRFGTLVQQLISAGLEEPALQQVLAAGVDAGTLIAEELLKSADNILQANQLAARLDEVAQKTGELAAGRFRSTGVTMAQAMLDGIQTTVNQFQISLTSKKLTAKQIKKLERDFAVQIGFDLTAGTLPAMADGAIVRRPTTALIGEQGAEAVIPITRPARALELLETSGLGALVRANSQTATVSIQNAVFQQPTDVDLIAQKVNAATSARLLTS